MTAGTSRTICLVGARARWAACAGASGMSGYSEVEYDGPGSAAYHSLGMLFCDVSKIVSTPKARSTSNVASAQLRRWTKYGWRLTHTTAAQASLGWGSGTRNALYSS